LPVAKIAIPGRNPEDPPPEPMTGLFGTHFTRPIAMRHYGPDRAWLEVEAWLRKNYKGPGRILVQDYSATEYLAWATNYPLIGGLTERAILHADSNLFRHYRDGDLLGEKLKEYFKRYGVGLVVVSRWTPKLEWRKDQLKIRALMPGSKWRIYEPLEPPSYFLKGKGKIQSQSLNLIQVDEAEGPEVIIKFHWIDSLKCRPNCQATRFPIPEDRAGFIRIKNPPRRFEIFNSYDLSLTGEH